jgi:histidinol-phosphate aminotransferase
MSQNLIYLDRNENHYGPAPACFKALHKKNFSKLSNYSRDFMRGVKSKLSEKLAQDFQIDESQVLLGYGGEDILKQVVHCYLHKDEKILVPQYSWWYYKVIADEVGGIRELYPIYEDATTFRFDVDKIIESINLHKPKVILISSPNNPTGNSMSIPELFRLLDAVKDTVVVMDEAYTVFVNGDRKYVKDIIDNYPNVLIIRTFSKYYALAGIRIGFAFMGKNLSQFSKFSSRYLGYNRLSERIAITALEAEDYYAEMRQNMLADLDMYFTELNQLPGFTAYKSEANFILVKIPLEIKASLNEFLKNKGIIIKFMNEDGLTNHLRITIGTREENRMALDAIKEFVAKQNA